MAMNHFAHPTHYIHCNTHSVRVYGFFFLRPVPRLLLHPMVILQSLHHCCPLADTYEWCLFGSHAAIVNASDLCELQLHEPSRDHRRLGIVEEVTNHLIEGSSEQDSESSGGLVYRGEIGAQIESYMDQLVRLTQDLRVTEYEEEEESEGEMCVICQAEFESHERVGVLPCSHRYHPRCIQQWLIRQNACPLCKAQALKI